MVLVWVATSVVIVLVWATLLISTAILQAATSGSNAYKTMVETKVARSTWLWMIFIFGPLVAASLRAS